MIKYVFSIIVLLLVYSAEAQKYKVEESTVTFFSEAPLENITAKNYKSAGLFELSSGEVAFSIPVSAFEFDKSLMQEHFNEKYMHTEKFPRSVFTGKISGYDVKVKGVQNVSVSGKITIHGVTKEITVQGTLEVSDNSVNMQGKFPVRLIDFDIERPQILWQNIAEEVEVTVNFKFKKNA